MSDVDKIGEGFEDVKKEVIPQTAGANLKEPIVGNIKVNKVLFNVEVDNTEEDILELIEKNENIEFSFNADGMPVLKETTVNMLSYESKRSYYRELDAKEAFERKAKQDEDDNYLEGKFKSFSSPTFASKFVPTADELKKYPNDEFVFVHKRPEEVKEAEANNYIKLGSVEGTPVGPTGQRANENMVRMVVSKEQHDAMVRYFGKKSTERVGGSGPKNEHIEYVGDNKVTTEIDNEYEKMETN